MSFLYYLSAIAAGVLLGCLLLRLMRERQHTCKNAITEQHIMDCLCFQPDGTDFDAAVLYLKNSGLDCSFEVRNLFDGEVSELV